MENYSKERMMAEVRQLISSEIYKSRSSFLPQKELENIQNGSFLSEKIASSSSRNVGLTASSPTSPSFLKSSAPSFNYNVWVAVNGVARQISITGELVAEGRETASALGA
jgi:hypothetical protein